jgi:hypothetical protein
MLEAAEWNIVSFHVSPLAGGVLFSSSNRNLFVNADLSISGHLAVKSRPVRLGQLLNALIGGVTAPWPGTGSWRFCLPYPVVAAETHSICAHAPDRQLHIPMSSCSELPRFLVFTCIVGLNLAPLDISPASLSNSCCSPIGAARQTRVKSITSMCFPPSSAYEMEYVGRVGNLKWSGGHLACQTGIKKHLTRMFLRDHVIV